MVEPASSREPHSQPSQRRRTGVRQNKFRFALALVLLILLAIFVPPWININSFRRSIVRSISAGLGRPVHADTVELTLLPRPAFILHNLTVAEDPAYGAEPVLMADTVTASLRASTLWHRRVEIADLRLDTPSLNLSRDAQGHWNFESLLRHSQALRRPPASASPPPPFPYVEATEARINFKLGPEKLPFSLEGAKLAVWKEPGNEWHLRMEARPVRTDLPVADAGQIRGEAMVQAADILENSPVHASAEWRRVQFGEISRLLYGEDEGWRGTVDWTAQAQGTLANTLLSTAVQVEEFRRAEFVPSAEMDLSAHCQAQYLRASNVLDSLQCNAPLGSGLLVAQGRWPLTVQSPPLQLAGALSALKRATPSLHIALQHLQANFFLDLLRHIHPGVDGDATASGEVNGQADCSWEDAAQMRVCTGEAQSSALTLRLPHLEQPLKLSPIMLISANGAAQPRTRLRRVKKKVYAIPSAVLPNVWTLQPAHLSLGASSTTTLAGTLNSTGVALKITGAADLTELFALAQALRIPAISGQVHSLHGNAQLALALQTTWLPQTGEAVASDPQTIQFTPSNWTGTLQLHDAVAKLTPLPGSVHLASATVNLTPASVEWANLKGSYAHTSFDGSLSWHTPCATAQSACARTFALHTANLDAAYLQAALHPGNSSSNLFTLVNPWAEGLPSMPKISGTLHADVLTFGRISLRNVALALRLEAHHAEITSISGNVFSGTLQGDPLLATASETEGTEPAVGSAEWGNGAPVYTLRAKLEQIDPASIAAIWQEHWGPGLASAEIDLKTHGWSAAELAEHAEGAFSAAWLNGAFMAPATSTTPLAKFQQWNGSGNIHHQTLIFASSQIIELNGLRTPHTQTTSPKAPRLTAAQSVTGTITFGRVLDLHLQPSGIAIKGTLRSPVFTSNPHAPNSAVAVAGTPRER